MSDDTEIVAALRSLSKAGPLALDLLAPREIMALAAVGMLPRDPVLLNFAARLHEMTAMCSKPVLEDRPLCACCGQHVDALGLAVMIRAEDPTAPWAASFPICATCEKTKTNPDIAAAVLATLRREFFPGLRRYEPANYFTEGGRA